jgi:hypothetical protein
VLYYCIVEFNCAIYESVGIFVVSNRTYEMDIVFNLKLTCQKKTPYKGFFN